MMVPTTKKKMKSARYHPVLDMPAAAHGGGACAHPGQEKGFGDDLLVEPWRDDLPYLGAAVAVTHAVSVRCRMRWAVGGGGTNGAPALLAPGGSSRAR